MARRVQAVNMRQPSGDSHVLPPRPARARGGKAGRARGVHTAPQPACMTKPSAAADAGTAPRPCRPSPAPTFAAILLVRDKHQPVGQLRHVLLDHKLRGGGGTRAQHHPPQRLALQRAQELRRGEGSAGAAGAAAAATGVFRIHEREVVVGRACGAALRHQRLRLGDGRAQGACMGCGLRPGTQTWQ